MLVKYWQAALLAAMTALTGNAVWAEDAPVKSGGNCFKKANCGKVKKSFGMIDRDFDKLSEPRPKDCCKSSECCKSCCMDGTCCKDKESCKNCECCKDKDCCKSCGCCKSKDCSCCKGKECCKGSCKQAKIAAIGRPAIVVVMPKPIVPLCIGGPIAPPCVIHPGPLPSSNCVVMPHPLPPPPPMLTPPGLPVPAMTSPVMPPQTVGMPLPPPPPPVACCPCPATASPVCAGPSCPTGSATNAGPNLDACLSILGMVSDLCCSHLRPTSLPAICLSSLGMLIDLCPPSVTPALTPERAPSKTGDREMFTATPVLPPPRPDYPAPFTANVPPPVVPCVIAAPTPRNDALEVRVVSKPYSDRLEMSVGEDSCVSCKKMTVKVGDSEITLTRLDGRVRVRGEDLKATAACVRTDRKNRLILEGDVHLRYRKDDQHASINAECIELDLAAGSLTIKPADAGAPYVPVRMEDIAR